jgi:Cupin-like domain
MPTYQGPPFQLVDTISADELAEQGGFQPRDRPLLVKGAVTQWPAWRKWGFNELAELKRPDGGAVIASFQNGLVEQGVTREPVWQPVSPYLTSLAQAATAIKAGWRDDVGLCPDQVWKAAKPGDTFHLNWAHMTSFPPNEIYLAQWDLLKEFPALREDFAIRQVWTGWRWTWEYVFIGPANTITGWHNDFPDNWFCQVRGVKEFMLVPPEYSAHMCTSQKFDWGATLSDIDVSRLNEMPEHAASFARVRGLYARVEAGDALFVPKRTWHSVVALEPSISLAVFGLTAPEIVFGGVAAEIRNVLHALHLYRWGNCTCHKMAPKPGLG